MSLFFDKQGKPLDARTWANLFETWEYKNVAQTQQGDIEISTVWLGLTNGANRNGQPLIFETMTFGLDEEIQQRYATIEEARAGHNQIAQLVEEKLKQP